MTFWQNKYQVIDTTRVMTIDNLSGMLFAVSGYGTTYSILPDTTCSMPVP